MLRWVALVALTGCVEAATLSPCGPDGLGCPDDTRCVEDVPGDWACVDEAAFCDDEGGPCDLVGAAGTCRAGRCVLDGCGNGVREPALGEVCDDGNRVTDDGCNNLCSSDNRCGNGLPDLISRNLPDGVREQCDCGAGDGALPIGCVAANGADRGTCSASCQIVRCGNGIREGVEACDDANNVSGDGCSADCAVLEGCDNGIVDPGEDCDCGGGVPALACALPNSDAPDAQCRPDCTRQRCGDDVVDVLAGEVCDDGDAVAGPGCDASCRSTNTCGNGQLDLANPAGPEQCDCGDGSVAIAGCVGGNSMAPEATCRPDCTVARCGDGVRSEFELCDGDDLGTATCASVGLYAGTPACTSACQLVPGSCTGYCGDGEVQAGEFCDGALLQDSCLEYGFDAGLATCGPLCSPDLSGCEQLGWVRVSPSIATDLVPVDEGVLFIGVDGRTYLDAFDGPPQLVFHDAGGRALRLARGLGDSIFLATESAVHRYDPIDRRWTNHAAIVGVTRSMVVVNENEVIVGLTNDEGKSTGIWQVTSGGSTRLDEWLTDVAGSDSHIVAWGDRVAWIADSVITTLAIPPGKAQRASIHETGTYAVVEGELQVYQVSSSTWSPVPGVGDVDRFNTGVGGEPIVVQGEVLADLGGPGLLRSVETFPGGVVALATTGTGTAYLADPLGIYRRKQHYWRAPRSWETVSGLRDVEQTGLLCTALAGTTVAECSKDLSPMLESPIAQPTQVVAEVPEVFLIGERDAVWRCQRDPPGPAWHCAIVVDRQGQSLRLVDLAVDVSGPVPSSFAVFANDLSRTGQLVNFVATNPGSEGVNSLPFVPVDLAVGEVDIAVVGYDTDGAAAYWKLAGQDFLQRDPTRTTYTSVALCAPGTAMLGAPGELLWSNGDAVELGSFAAVQAIAPSGCGSATIATASTIYAIAAGRAVPYRWPAATSIVSLDHREDFPLRVFTSAGPLELVGVP